MAGKGGDGVMKAAGALLLKQADFLYARSRADQSEQLHGVTEAGVFKLGSGTPEVLSEFCENLKGK